jgi:hypothetical protein
MFLLNNNFGKKFMGIGDWGLGIGPNPQSPIPNPQSPIPKYDSGKFSLILIFIIFLIKNFNSNKRK